MPTPPPANANESPRALIPAPERRLINRPRLSLPITRNVALGMAAGAAGTFFAKRLVELVAEDLYRGLKRLIGRRTQRPTPSPSAVQTTPPMAEPREPVRPMPDRAVIMRIVHIRQMVWLPTRQDTDADTLP